MVCNGTKGIDLVSINSAVRQPLVAFSNVTMLNAPVGVFPDEEVASEEDPVHMVFQSFEIKPDGKREYQMHKLAL